MTGIAGTRALILSYSLLSAVFYAGLLPLWEGFDELFHYGYVQHLSTTGTFPVVGKSTLSRELWTAVGLSRSVELKRVAGSIAV